MRTDRGAGTADSAGGSATQGMIGELGAWLWLGTDGWAAQCAAQVNATRALGAAGRLIGIGIAMSQPTIGAADARTGAVNAIWSIKRHRTAAIQHWILRLRRLDVRKPPIVLCYHSIGEWSALRRAIESNGRIDAPHNEYITMSKRLDLLSIPMHEGSGYPAPFHEPCVARRRQRLGDAAGLTDFGVNLLRLPPGAWSSQRHWHTAEDEFVWVLEGEVVLVTDAGEETLRAGDCAGFKAGVHDGHHLQNRTSHEAVLLEIGARKPDDEGEYPDIDMRFRRGDPVFTRKDGTPYPKR